MTAKKTNPKKPSERFDNNKRYPDKKNGRPGHLRRVKYTKKLGRHVAEQIVLGKSLKTLCATDPEFPALQTVMKWAMNPEHHFAALYEDARRKQNELMMDDVIDIADSTDNENAAGNKLRIETRKWMASKIQSEKYGDKQQIVGAGGGEIQIAVISSGDGLGGKKEGSKA